MLKNWWDYIQSTPEFPEEPPLDKSQTWNEYLGIPKGGTSLTAEEPSWTELFDPSYIKDRQTRNAYDFLYNIASMLPGPEEKIASLAIPAFAGYLRKQSVNRFTDPRVMNLAARYEKLWPVQGVQRTELKSVPVNELRAQPFYDASRGTTSKGIGGEYEPQLKGKKYSGDYRQPLSEPRIIDPAIDYTKFVPKKEQERVLTVDLHEKTHMLLKEVRETRPDIYNELIKSGTGRMKHGPEEPFASMIEEMSPNEIKEIIMDPLKELMPDLFKVKPINLKAPPSPRLYNGLNISLQTTQKGEKVIPYPVYEEYKSALSNDFYKDYMGAARNRLGYETATPFSKQSRQDIERLANKLRDEAAFKKLEKQFQVEFVEVGGKRVPIAKYLKQLKKEQEIVVQGGEKSPPFLKIEKGR